MSNLKKSSGFALIEAMVSIVVVALGILGILGVQLRTLADTQTGVRRAQAIRLIEDLSERAKANPSALDNISSYEIGTGTAPVPANNCFTSACNATQLAAFDVRTWKRNVQSILPLSDAIVFEVADETSNNRQLGVLISWRESERADGTAAENQTYKDVFKPTVTGVAAAACPTDRICHLQYIQLTKRCTPYDAGGVAAAAFYCGL